MLIDSRYRKFWSDKQFCKYYTFSDWMAFPLPDNQLKYSAYDAAAPLFMYLDWTAQEKDSGQVDSNTSKRTKNKIAQSKNFNGVVSEYDTQPGSLSTDDEDSPNY